MDIDELRVQEEGDTTHDTHNIQPTTIPPKFINVIESILRNPGLERRLTMFNSLKTMDIELFELIQMMR